MEKRITLLFIIVFLYFGFAKAQNLPNQKETLNTIVKVNDYFMKKYKDYRTPSYVNNVVRPSNIWTRGVYYEGLMALYSIYLYGMAWGVRKGLLDRNEYLPVLLKAWNAMVKECVHPNGFLGYVQGTGKEPKDSQPVTYDKVPDFEDFGVGCFLLAGSEVYKLK